MRRPSSCSSLLAVMAVGLVACTSDRSATVTTSSVPRTTGTSTDTTGPRRAVTPGRSRLRLEQADGCDDLLTRLRALAEQHVTPWGLDAYGGMFFGDRVPATAAASAESAVAAPAARDESAAGASSGTNVQEQGIDEGDQVDNDGRHVYSVLDGRLRVVDTVTGEQSDTALPDNTGQHQMVLDGDRLVVVSGGWWAGPAGRGVAADTMMVPGYGSTIVSVFDVGDRMSPKVAERRQLEGMALVVRSASGTVRIVVSSPLGARLPFVQPARQGETVERKAKELNLQVVRESTIGDWLPRFGEPGSDGTLGDPEPALACDQLALPVVDSGLGLTWVASIDTSGSVKGSAGVVAAGGTTYATASSLYVTTVQWTPQGADADVRPVRPADPETAVHRFALGAEGTAAYEATGIVPGTLLNSYAMSEREGALRIATTVDHPDGSAPSSSGLHVLRERDGELVEVGKVDGLGKTERIYAVRYVGDYAYVVTFRRTDPLYVIDLRDETKPTLTGELKIPGYSAYLHPLEDGRLLGVGQNATDDGRVIGLQVSLFDVSDPAKPMRLDNADLGGASEAEWDPHAFLWWAPTGSAYIPLQPWWGGPEPGTSERPPGGLAAVRVDGDRLTQAGTLPAPGTAAAWNGEIDPRNGAAPWQMPVQRAMVVDGKLVAISLYGVRIADPATLEVAKDVRWES